MKKSMFGLLCVGLMLFVFSGCSGDEGVQQAVFEMEENATTGYTWQVSQEGSGSMDIQREEMDGVSATSSSEMVVGAGQMIRYTLVPQQAGDVRVTFVLERPWEGGEKAYEATYTFEVQEDGTCTLVGEEENILDGGTRPVFEGPLEL